MWIGRRTKEEVVHKEGVMGVESWLAMPDIGITGLGYNTVE